MAIDLINKQKYNSIKNFNNRKRKKLQRQKKVTIFYTKTKIKV